jgi:hypothetical protein
MTKGKRKKNRQINNQRKKTEEQAIQWQKEKERRTDNSMTKGKRQKNFFLWSLNCLFFCLFPLVIELSVLSVFFLWSLTSKYPFGRTNNFIMIICIKCRCRIFFEIPILKKKL